MVFVFGGKEFCPSTGRGGDLSAFADFLHQFLIAFELTWGQENFWSVALWRNGSIVEGSRAESN